MSRTSLAALALLLVACSGDNESPPVTITVDTLVTFGDAEGPGALPWAPRHVITDVRGRYWAVHKGVSVFNADGTIARALVATGAGPGEFGSYGLVAAATADSMLILDAANNRATLLSLDFYPGRMIPTVGGPGGASKGLSVLHWPDTVVYSGSVLTREFLNFGLHTISFDGSRASLSKSFGDVDRGRTEYRITNAHAGHVWSVKSNEYVLQKLNGRGEAVDSIRLRPAWFKGISATPMGGPQKKPTGFIRGIEQDSSGLLWVILQLAADDWQSAWSKDIPKNATEIRQGDIDDDKLFHTRVDVIDPRGKRVVGSLALPGRAVGPLPDRRLAMSAPTPGGVPRVMILQLKAAARSAANDF
jgi:hypothetical protein